MNDAEMLRAGAWNAAQAETVVPFAMREARDSMVANAGVIHLARYAANLRILVKLAISRLDFQDFLSEIPAYREVLGLAMEDERRLLPADFQMTLPPRLKAA